MPTSHAALAPRSISDAVPRLDTWIAVHSFAFVLLTLAVFISVSSGSVLASSATPNEEQPDTPPGLGDPGKLLDIKAVTGRGSESGLQLSGKDSGQQLVIQAHYDTGQVRDVTRLATFHVSPPSVAAVDETGYLTPIAEGVATIEVKFTPPSSPHKNESQSFTSAVMVNVTDIEVDPAINFPSQIVPVFTKYGCNGGGCHGKSGGQNGFSLSLLGFEPTEDYEFLVKEGRGRRVFPAIPERSLLLTKSIGEVPHGGGQRFEQNSPPYRLLRRWIEQGMPYGNPDDPVVERIEVHPRTARMPREGQQQLVAIAHFSNGSTEDVTRMTQFESNDVEMAEVDATGLVSTARLTGSVTVMARYQGHVDVFRATVPLGMKLDSLPPETNFVDSLVNKNLRDLGLPPSSICDDVTFIRRVTIDLAGRLPSLKELDQFQQDHSTDKRQKLVDRLLASSDYADYFANKWGAILRNKRQRPQDKLATYAFHDWLQQSLYHNKPYDELVREIVTASGEVGKNPPVAWYREVSEREAQVEDTAQLFLGLRIQCARCHHHPFEKWSQDDYYRFSAFFSQVRGKKGELSGQSRIYTTRVQPVATNPKTGQQVLAAGLGSTPVEIESANDARHALVDWMAESDNPFFAKSLVNRYWKHFFGRGLVDPEDDMRVTNPACNPELLDRLAHSFVESNFDLKQLVRTICNSTTYQLSALPNDWNVDDRQNFSRFYPRRLNAEVLLDAINQVSGTATQFQGLPAGTRATQLPDNAFDSYFLTVFGRPEMNSACECERAGDANLAQSLHLLNSREVQGKLSDPNSRAVLLAANDDRPHADRIRELYLRALSRQPTIDELTVADDYLRQRQETPQRAYEDLLWVLINTKEFMFNH